MLSPVASGKALSAAALAASTASPHDDSEHPGDRCADPLCVRLIARAKVLAHEPILNDDPLQDRDERTRDRNSAPPLPDGRGRPDKGEQEPRIDWGDASTGTDRG